MEETKKRKQFSLYEKKGIIERKDRATKIDVINMESAHQSSEILQEFTEKSLLKML